MSKWYLFLAATVLFAATAATQQTPTHKGSTASLCQIRITQLSGESAHLDQLKADSLPDVLKEVDACVLHQQLTRSQAVSAYKARMNVDEEIKRRSEQQDARYREGADGCVNDLRPAAEQNLKPFDKRFENVSNEALDKQYGRTYQCVTSFNRDQRIGVAAYLAGIAIQLERFRRFAVLYDQKMKGMADRYNVDTADLASKLSALRREYIAHLDQDVRFYDQLQKEQRADQLAQALNSLLQFSASSRSSPQVQRIYQPPAQIHCTTQTIPPPVQGLSTWVYTNCY